MAIYRSSELHPENNNNDGGNMYRSYSYGQHSQENKSNNSKRKK
jgi:hypothetical protein